MTSELVITAGRSGRTKNAVVAICVRHRDRYQLDVFAVVLAAVWLGSLKGMVEGLNAVIQASGPNTKIIPGHGPTVDKASVASHRDMIIALRDRVAQVIQQGKTACHGGEADDRLRHARAGRDADDGGTFCRSVVRRAQGNQIGFVVQRRAMRVP